MLPHCASHSKQYAFAASHIVVMPLADERTCEVCMLVEFQDFVQVCQEHLKLMLRNCTCREWSQKSRPGGAFVFSCSYIWGGESST